MVVLDRQMDKVSEGFEMFLDRNSCVWRFGKGVMELRKGEQARYV